MNIKYVHTHHVDVTTRKKYFFASRKNIPDDTLFIFPSDMKSRLSKADKKKLNQYEASAQGKHLYDREYGYLETIDRRTNSISKRYCQTWDKAQTTLYLTKRSNSVHTIIAWELEIRSEDTDENTLMKLASKRKITPDVKIQRVNNEDTAWGNKITTKTNGCIRICMENINNITSDQDKNLKLDNGKRWLIKNEVDIACWLEVGVPWHKRKRQNRLPALMRDGAWSSQRIVTANNSHECSGKRQFGGTAVMAFDYITSIVSASGYDATGLGRWSWLSIQGKYGKTTTIIAAYCPCKSKGGKPETVYMQHKRYLMSIDRDECLREAFRSNLSNFITSHQNKGEQMVLCIDLNEDTTRSNGPIQQTLLCNNGLVDALKYKHGCDTPATHNRGSRTIDAIFVSAPILELESTGWLRFGEGIGDHRIAYLDIKLEHLINKDKYEIVTSTARILQVKNEDAVRRYTTICENPAF